MDNLILTISYIPKVGKKSIDYFIENITSIPKDEQDILETFIQLKSYNKRIKIPTLDEIKIANEKKEKIINLSSNQQIKVVDKLNTQFPKMLKHIPNGPKILFYKGNYEAVINEKSIAIIGSRRAGQTGINLSYEMGQKFGTKGYTVVSGLAVGCDENAHKGCLSKNGKTVAILAGGLDNIYPSKNRSLAENIIDNDGCLLSEYPIGTNYFKNNFIERDRIQSGLSKAILVVETDLNSGTMHTVKFAKEQNRIIACCNIDVRGNDKLIKEDKCMTIYNDNDITQLMNKIKIYNSTGVKMNNITHSDQIKFEL